MARTTAAPAPEAGILRRIGSLATVEPSATAPKAVQLESGQPLKAVHLVVSTKYPER